MERCSFFIKNKALFGSFPTQENIYFYEEMGVRHFIDLTCEGEKRINNYETKYDYIKYPIIDRRVPSDWKSFSKFIIKISDIIGKLEKDDKIYIHCKGGHGRSGVVVASLLCYLYDISPSEAITMTTLFHNNRTDMKEKWRLLGSPQTRSQKHFVCNFFEPLYIYKNCGTYFTYNYNNDANVSIKLDMIGKFKNVTSAINYMKDKHKNDWGNKRKEIMFNILTHKFNQHEDLKSSLINTGLRPITYQSENQYWGINNDVGQNITGKLIMKLRYMFYMS